MTLQELLQTYATAKNPCIYAALQNRAVICDSYEEMEKIYDQTVGDDGPTEDKWENENT